MSMHSHRKVMRWSAVHDYSCILPRPFKPIVVANKATIFIASDRESESRSAELNSWRYQPSLGFDMHSTCTYLYSLKYATTMYHTHCQKKIAKGDSKYFFTISTKSKSGEILHIILSKNPVHISKAINFLTVRRVWMWVRIRMSIQQSTLTFMRMEILYALCPCYIYTFVSPLKEQASTTTYTFTRY